MIEKTNGTAPPVEKESEKSVTPQELFETFVKDNGLALHVYTVAPKSGTPVPVFDYLPQGWNSLKIIATKSSKLTPG